MAAEVQSLFALKLLVWNTVWTWPKLVVEGTEELLNQRMRELTVKIVRALIPTSIILHISAPLQIIEVEMWRSPEVLLPVRVVALGPLMLLVDVRAEACLV